jgi:DNA replication protein DnaC
MKKTQDVLLDSLLLRARSLGYWALVNNWTFYANKPWVPELLEAEEKERSSRSLARRTKRSRLSKFKPICDFDWSWPTEINHVELTDLFSLEFMKDATNILLIGDIGVGKTMIAKNLAHHAISNGHTALFISAHSLLNELADYTTGTALLRRIKSYARYDILVIDELGYLASSHQHADLLFQVINNRYEEKSTIITSNKPPLQWQSIFPSATCATAIIDRLTHRAKIFDIKAKSYRQHEAEIRQNVSINNKKQKSKK